MVITISGQGYIKRQPLSSYRKQARGGRGITAMATKEEDLVEHLFVCSSKDTLLFFTNKGKVFGVKAYDVPAGSRVSKGRSIANFLHFAAEEKVASVLSVKEFENSRFVVMATAKGLVKRVNLAAFSNIRKTGIIAVTLDKGDNLISAAAGEDGNDEVLLNSSSGKCIRLKTKKVRDMGRKARGVKGILVGRKEVVLGMVLINSYISRQDFSVLTVTEKGFAKRTNIKEYRTQSRAGKGVIGIKVSSKIGNVAAVVLVSEEDEVVVITHKGVLIRCKVNAIRPSGRNTQGVRLIKLDKDDLAATAARVVE